MKMLIITVAVAFIAGFATPILAHRYSTSCVGCTVAEDVSYMADGSKMSGDGAWGGHLAYSVERFFFYVRHPLLPRPRGKGDLWIMEQQAKWTKPIVFHCSSQGGPCRTEMPRNELAGRGK